jgi:phosphatidylserine/phosphatidylglycerophosphate/cardiolipin synthase-like enzyme
VKAAVTAAAGGYGMLAPVTSTETASSTEVETWFLTKDERANPRTRLDERHPGEQAWSEGNLVQPLIHGATYFAELYKSIEATVPGDLIFFADWQGDADERLTGEPGSEVAEVLARADERGVDVRGLVWRSHWDKLGFTAGANRRLGEQLQKRGAEALLDMRVRTGGSHHQKFVVFRHRDDPTRDVAYVGGIDLCHSRRDDADHGGDPQAMQIAKEYGETPPWHDIQVAVRGPAVHDVETVFRERWEDPTGLTRHPVYLLQDKVLRLDMSPDPLPQQTPPPPPVPTEDGGTHVVQLLRTYPNLRHGRDYPFARGGERSVARGYTKAMSRARRLVFVEDQYLWGHHIGNVFTEALKSQPDLFVIAVVPLHPDTEGLLSRTPELLGRRRAMRQMMRAAPDRIAVYGLENKQGTPIYVHAKTCVVDDTWATVGSDNFNRRSWTHDSELTVAVLDQAPYDEPHSRFARTLRLRLAAEHLGREVGEDDLEDVMADCLDAGGTFRAFEETARALDDWHRAGRAGARPPGQLRRMQPPDLSLFERAVSSIPYLLLHDPDGRPRPLQKADDY